MKILKSSTLQFVIIRNHTFKNIDKITTFKKDNADNQLWKRNLNNIQNIIFQLLWTPYITLQMIGYIRKVDHGMKYKDLK